MTLRDILDEISEEEAKIATPVETTEEATLDTSTDDITKLAEVLDALAEEDTIYDEIAKLAVLADSKFAKEAQASLTKTAVSVQKADIGFRLIGSAGEDLGRSLRTGRLSQFIGGLSPAEAEQQALTKARKIEAALAEEKRTQAKVKVHTEKTKKRAKKTRQLARDIKSGEKTGNPLVDTANDVVETVAGKSETKSEAGLGRKTLVAAGVVGVGGAGLYAGHKLNEINSREKMRELAERYYNAGLAVGGRNG